MTAYKRGDVVLVPFPFSDQTMTKRRPAVIVSSNLYNNASSDDLSSTENALKKFLDL